MSESARALLADCLGLSVSRETAERLEVYSALLTKWNQSINLVSPTTINDLWSRHIIDSAQLITLAGGPTSWVDLGSGGGLPGIIVAAILAETTPKCDVTLIESDRRKCLFMATALREMGLKATIQTRRIESTSQDRYHITSARALAPLTNLLFLAEAYRASNGTCLFPKGRNAEAELTQARRDWHIEVDRIPSQTDPEAVILRIKEFSRVSTI